MYRLPKSDAFHRLEAALKQRVMVLDGAMGTMIQRYRLEEADYHNAQVDAVLDRGAGGSPGNVDRPPGRGDTPLKGNMDLLPLTRPDVIREIHRAYVEAGAELVETATFNANAISQSDYGMEPLVHDMNVAAARLAREAAGSRAFVLGTMAMNQGRKAYPAMLHSFFEFAKDKDNCYYLIDTEAVSPAGWNIPALCQQNQHKGWDVRKLIFRQQAQQAGLTQLAQRYNLLDVHMVLAHREGYGLPLVEAMACGAVSIAMDYCSGTEIVGEGRGVLIPTTPVPYPEHGTWGGAIDHLPDTDAVIAALNRLYDDPDERQYIAQSGLAWAKRQSWHSAAQAVQDAIESGFQRVRQRTEQAAQQFQALQQPSAPQAAQPDGVQPQKETVS